MAPNNEAFVDEAIKEPIRISPASDSSAMTQRIRWKLDSRIVPVLAALFLCSFLDRTNAGNAKTYHLEEDLAMSNHQYDTGLAVFFATYIASEIPSNLVLRKLSPRIWLPALTMMWGIVTMCLGWVRNYQEFVAVRAILGLCEGGLLPGMVLYLSGMYTRAEMALRLGLFYTAASLSGAFGGLLARGLTSMGKRGRLYSWSWIFIIEGILTVVVGFVAYFLLPNSVETASFLTEAERTFASSRLHLDRPSRPAGDGSEHHQEQFRWSELGYTANDAQLWSVIPYAVASVVTVAVALLSDRLQLRGTIMLVVLTPAIVGVCNCSKGTS
ncbi:hypothetical protein BUE80_DR012780 [Diplocarpon rosae]|nr:hypothetical protein BUE80_DR012780 [Diplocarpon rosae]